MDLYLRRAGVAVLAFKDIGKPLIQLCLYRCGTVDRHVHVIAKVERAYIVQPDDVVIVLMGNENRIQPVNARSEHLCPEVRTAVNGNILSTHLQQSRCAQTFILWVC